MSGKAIKRASPGAEDEKNPLGDVELGDEDAKKLQAIQRDLARAELVLERAAQDKLRSVYEKRRPIVKAIPKFWPVALMNHNMFAMNAQHDVDQVALSYLEDLWLTRDKTEGRCFTLEFYFKKNPFFENTVLTKEFQYLVSPAASSETADEDGITESMLDFSWERDVQPQAIKIDWKDDSKNLSKLHPRVTEPSEDLPAEGGSFFTFFEHASDPFDLGVMIANDIFPEAIDYFLGNMGGDDIEDDEDEDDEDDDEDEIDLEKPRLKRQKTA